MTDTLLLELRGISKSFGSVQALTDVDFEVRNGEVMALVGDNGAGKSTLVKCVAGTHSADSGEILFEGTEVHIHGPKDAAKLGIEVVYQDLALCDNLAQQTINAVEAAGIGPIPVSGQDASAAGIQNVLLGKQTMTVYKPIEAEAKVAAAVALALVAGEDVANVQSDFEFSLIGIGSADGKPTDSPTGDGVVPYFALVPIGVTVDNIADTVIADGFRTVEEVCTGDTAETDFCKENA